MTISDGRPKGLWVTATMLPAGSVALPPIPSARPKASPPITTYRRPRATYPIRSRSSSQGLDAARLIADPARCDFSPAEAAIQRERLPHPRDSGVSVGPRILSRVGAKKLVLVVEDDPG